MEWLGMSTFQSQEMVLTADGQVSSQLIKCQPEMSPEICQLQCSHLSHRKIGVCKYWVLLWMTELILKKKNSKWQVVSTYVAQFFFFN